MKNKKGKGIKKGRAKTRDAKFGKKSKTFSYSLLFIGYL